jgi:photosystem II stability/assembly factor-like uncharacterized protein
LNKRTQKETGRRAQLLLPALVAFSILALAVGAILLSMSPGGQQTGSTERPYVGGDLHSLAVDPTDPDKVMVGGHDGGAVSENGGKTWRQASGLEGADPMGWVIDPNDPSKMYVGGHPGFYYSEDGGKSFSQDNSGLPGTDVHGLGMDPQNPNILYAYIVKRGLYRSPDAGQRWELVNANEATMGPILVDPREPNTLYLVGGKEGGFRQSTDSGKSWRQVGTIPGGMAMSISQNQKELDTFYAANDRVLKSTDGGKNWQPTGDGLPSGVSAVAVSSSDPRVLYAGTLEGTNARVFRSDDGGESWRAQN